MVLETTTESFNGRIIFLMFWLGGLLWFWKQWQNHFSYVVEINDRIMGFVIAWGFLSQIHKLWIIFGSLRKVMVLAMLKILNYLASGVVAFVRT